MKLLEQALSRSSKHPACNLALRIIASLISPLLLLLLLHPKHKSLDYQRHVNMHPNYDLAYLTQVFAIHQFLTLAKLRLDISG